MRLINGESDMKMMMHGKLGTWTGVAAILVVAAVLMGCETAERRRSLEVTPTIADVSRAGDRVVLTASVPEQVDDDGFTNQVAQLLYPLEWTVSEPANGRIISTAGDTAVYYADIGDGRNVVTVRDQANREGLANIN
jgi:hypothetical protein